jgi:hypothetical protein
MRDASIAVPEAYKIVETVGATESMAEYVARHKADDAYVRLRVFNFHSSTPQGAPALRHHLHGRA